MPMRDDSLVEFFGGEDFSATDYVRKYFENNNAEGAADRCEELEGLRRQTEESLRQEVVRNYTTFMHATAQIQSMERDIDALRSLLSTAAGTLASFQSVRLTERQEGSSNRLQTTPAAAALNHTSFSATANATSLRGLKLPEWLDKAPTELEELLLERKHDVAVKLIRQVKGFAANVRNATNLGRGVAAIFSQADSMAAALSRRLISEITGSNTFTAWGFTEHKKNFQLLIDLGYADAAAAAFVRERSALVRRSLHMVETTSDPLTYVQGLSSAFFGQTLDTVESFLKLFCGGNAAFFEPKAAKSGKSAGFVQIYLGVKESGAAPFCRLVTWLDRQIEVYAKFIGRQIRAASVGAHTTRAADAQLPLTNPPAAAPQSTASPGKPSANSRGASNSPPRKQAAAEPVGIGTSQLDPSTCTLFSTVSIMLEDAFAAAEAAGRLGFPVSVPLASHLTADIASFVDGHVHRTQDALDEVLHRDPCTLEEYSMSPPEALLHVQSVLAVSLTASCAAVVREVRDLLEYSSLLTEPFSTSETAQGCSSEHFAELQLHIMAQIYGLLNHSTESLMGTLRRRSGDKSLSRAQAEACSSSLAAMQTRVLPKLGLWCTAVLPQVTVQAQEQNATACMARLQAATQATEALAEGLPYTSVLSPLRSPQSSSAQEPVSPPALKSMPVVAPTVTQPKSILSNSTRGQSPPSAKPAAVTPTVTQPKSILSNSTRGQAKTAPVPTIAVKAPPTIIRKESQLGAGAIPDDDDSNGEDDDMAPC